MSIRPSYGRRSVLQVLSDGMSQHPPTGNSCCEEAALNAAEVDRLTRERDTLQRCVDSWAARAEKAEDDAKWYRDLALKADATIEEAEHDRDELQAKLDDLTMTVKELQPSENRPTLDREAVRAAHKKWLDEPSTGSIEGDQERLIDIMTALVPAAEQHPTLDREAVRKVAMNWLNDAAIVGNIDEDADAITDAIMELAPAVPSWLGDVPDKPEAKRIVGDTWEVDGRRSKVTWSAEEFRRDGYRRIALADAIEAEEAQRSAEDGRVEDQAKALGETISQYGYWCNFAESTRERYRAAIRAGWTKEDQ